MLSVVRQAEEFGTLSQIFWKRVDILKYKILFKTRHLNKMLIVFRVIENADAE